jgi:hypothetical protein
MTTQIGYDDLDLPEVEVIGAGGDWRRVSVVGASAPSAAVRRLGTLAAASVGLCTLFIALLHFLPAAQSLDPLATPISNYAQTPVGWLFDAAVIVLALGLAALLCALVLGGWVATSSAAFAVLTACCIGLIIVVLFPDRTAHGALTTSGRMHWAAAMVTFAGIPVAPALLGHRRNIGAHCAQLPGIARWLSVAAGGWFAVLFVGSVLQLSTSLPLWHIGGAIERGLAVTEMLIAIVLATWARQGCRCQRRTHRGLASARRAIARPPGR